MKHDSTPAGDLARARELALRYRCEFVNLQEFQLQPDLLANIPADVMYRYRFVPVSKMPDGRIAIALADPSQLMRIDEISLLLGQRVVVHVAALAQIDAILKGVQENPPPIADKPDEPPDPSRPDAPVGAPLKPRPPRRSAAAKAVPEEGL